MNPLQSIFHFFTSIPFMPEATSIHTDLKKPKPFSGASSSSSKGSRPSPADQGSATLRFSRRFSRSRVSSTTGGPQLRVPVPAPSGLGARWAVP